MVSELVAAVVREAVDGNLLDCSVYSLHLPIGPGVVGLCQAMFNPIGLADPVEAHRPGLDGISVPRLLCELGAIGSGPIDHPLAG